MRPLTRAASGLVAVLAVTGAILCLPGTVQAHPHLNGRWEENGGSGWYLHFFPGTQVSNGVWTGQWRGKLPNGFHDKGVYTLTVGNGVHILQLSDSTGTVTATVHVGYRHLKYGGATYYRK